MSVESSSVIVYYKVCDKVTGNSKLQGNFQSTYTTTEDLINHWRDHLTETFGHDRNEIFFIGVFKL